MSKSITIELTFDETEWAEIYYGVETKLHSLQDGAYGDPRHPDVIRWSQQLEDILERLEIKLQIHKVNY